MLMDKYALAKKIEQLEGLTNEEKVEQKLLRERYLKAFRENFRAQLENIEIVDDVEKTN